MRKTIAVLIDYIDHLSRGYEFELREAFHAASCERGTNLMVLAGRPLEDPNAWSAAHNCVYELVAANSIDGLILATGSLGQYTGVSGVERLAARYPSLPKCSLGLAIPNLPSVVLDARSGMEALVEHVLVHHGCERIAFLGGPHANPDAEIRISTFRDVMARHGREIDPRLVCEGDFSFSFGQRAVTELLASGASFDAVIAANDGLALGAVEALRAHGLRVPLNVRVTGFDDLAMARLGDPPLSTVRQPLREMAALTLERVLSQIAGEVVPPYTTLPTQFIPRESCGCGSYGVRTSSLPPLELSRRSAEFVAANTRRLLRLLAATQRGPGEVTFARAQRVIAALEAELNGERLAFLSELELLLGTAGDDSEIFEEFQRLVTLLRGELRPLADPQLEELWHEARTQISLLNTRAQVRQRMQLEEMYDRLLATGQRLSTNLELASLERALIEELPIAHVRNALVLLYANEARTQFETFLCLRDGARFEPKPGPYPAAQLFPEDATFPERRYTWIALALTFETQRLGVLLFEYAPSIVAYEMFRDRISLALKTADMHREIVRQTAEQERHTQERVAAAERIQSLSVLAGGVAHDLNNALGPLAALPDVILQELAELTQSMTTQPTEIVNDLTTIKAAALRAAQTIKDLLTLGRQRQVKKEPLDLNQATLTSVCVFPREALTGGGDNVQLMVRLSPTPLFMEGSEAHIVRAVSNLVFNAAEAVAPKGNVVVRTFALSLREPLSGYELVEPGEYAVVTVSDNGSGIPADKVRRIFEPFFSAKKLQRSGASGGGSGLGLAIVHGVVKEHAGFINVESTPGVSTVFTLYFPRSAEAAKPSAPPFVAARGHGKILVLDDEPMQLRTARRILVRAGYEVVTADTAAQALNLIGAEPSDTTAEPARFDIVILDMILQDGADGVDVFDRIRKRLPEQKGILVSGHAPMERGQLALERGMQWLSKPYTAEALIQAVQTTLTVAGSRVESGSAIAPQSASSARR